MAGKRTENLLVLEKNHMEYNDYNGYCCDHIFYLYLFFHAEKCSQTL